MRPDDPGQYMYQKFGESLRAAPASPSQPKKDDQEGRKGDVSMNHAAPAATTEMVGSSTLSQDLHQLISTPNKVDTLMSEPPNDADETSARNTQAQSSGTDQTDGQEGPAALPTALPSMSSPKENTESSIAQDSLGESAPLISTSTLRQPTNLTTRSAGSGEQNSGDPVTSNAAGLSSSPASGQ